MKAITVIGCGTMGSRIINALLVGGCDVTIVDLNTEAAQPFVERGAKHFTDLDQTYDTECILVNLPTHSIAKKVILGADPEKLNGRMLINTTTSTPEEVIEMDTIANKLGMYHLDAKIENYPGDIGSKNAYLVYSGNRKVFDEMKPALEAIGQAAFLGEKVEGASITDIAILEVHFGAIATLAESAAYCIKKNYPVEIFIEQLRNILPMMLEGNYRAFEDGLKEYDRTFDDASECALTMETIAMETILRSINDSGVKTPCGDSIIGLFKDGIENGNGKKNVVAIVNELI